MDKNPNEKPPGEDPEGKFHYNPGNMAGKNPESRSRPLETLGSQHLIAKMIRLFNWQPPTLTSTVRSTLG
jgi:hypothetical protein